MHMHYWYFEEKTAVNKAIVVLGNISWSTHSLLLYIFRTTLRLVSGNIFS